MSDPIALLSNSKITSEEFFAFLPTIGAKIRNEATHEGVLSKGNHHIWIYLNNRELEALEEYEVSEKEMIFRELGGISQTCIIIEISSTPGSKKLVFEFAHAFAKRWKCIVYDLQNKFYSHQQLLELHTISDDFDDLKY